MKRRIDIKDLRINLEEHYFKKIEPLIEVLRKDYTFLIDHEQRKDVEFYSLISYSIDINSHYAIKYLIERVKTNLMTDIDISMYLFQSAIFNITCLRRNKNEKAEILIFVSQHFFNNLGEDEQLAIIGHEVAHVLLGHLDFPTQEIISYPFSLDEINSLKADLLDWSKACEITADMIGLVANDFNFKAYSTAIIKHFTGLNDSSNSNFNITPMVDLTLKQYTQLAEDPIYGGGTSTHPLTPLRVKIINSAIKTLLVKNFGELVEDSKIEKAKIEYNELINNLIKGIYPEMLPGKFIGSEVLPAMAFAVALSDGNIDLSEEKAIRRMLPKSQLIDKYLKEIREKEGRQMHYSDIVNELIEESIDISSKNKYSKHTLVPIIRFLLVIAASDGEITSDELKTIYHFSKQFMFSKQEIITILKTHNPIHY